MGKLSEAEKKRLKWLGPALDAQKRADMSHYAEAAAECERIETEIAAIETAMRSAADALDPADVTAYARFEIWRTAQKERIAGLNAALRQAEEMLDLRREALLRSNGEVEALKRLME